MRNEGDPKSSASHSPADSVEESKFTAVNNNNNYNGNGNGGTIIVGRHAVSAPLPLLSAPSPRDSGITTGSTSGAASPRLVLPTVAEEQWRMHNRTASAVDAAGVAQKRKRSLERSVTPTTQTTHHHLAAHEAAAGADEQAAKIQQQYFRDQQQQAIRPDDRVGMGEIGHGLNYEEEIMRHDDGSTRAGTQEGSPQPGQDNRKRKRVFSNRTKTGCITCRRRKKKCDEGKPECSNCKRGGFVCEGYSGKVSWTKPPGKQNTGVSTPVNIQSKGEHPGSTSVSPSSNYVRPVHMIQNQIPHRVQVVEEVHRPQSPQPRGGINYQPRTGPIIIEDANDPPLSPELRQHPYPNDPSQQSPQLQSYPHGGPPNLPPAQGISTPGGHRRISFSQTAISAAPGALQRQRSEKEKMINSELYYANCPELVEDRGRCKSACWRFNEAASNPTLGISRIEIGRLLLDVLRPEKEWEVVNSTTAHNQVTYMSQDGFPSDIVDVRVDAPFTCSYGYNIRLEKGVLIEFGCTILDSCSVTIKARTIISPNVSIYSATHPIDPRKRNGAQGPEMAKPVLIEEDCWLGGNVIVLGGITIGKGSVVGAGSVVTRDVPPFTVVAGNPARVIRGIYQNGIDM